MERHFERSLEELKQRLLWMGSLAERAVHQAVHSVLDSDEKLAESVLREENTVNELQIEIDDRVVQRWRYSWADGHVRGVDVFRIRDGKVAEKLSYVKG